MFVIPVVASSSITSVQFVDIVFFIVDMSSGFTTTLQIIFCYKFYYAFFMTYKVYLKLVSIHLSISSYVKMIFYRYL